MSLVLSVSVLSSFVRGISGHSLQLVKFGLAGHLSKFRVYSKIQVIL